MGIFLGPAPQDTELRKRNDDLVAEALRYGIFPPAWMLKSPKRVDWLKRAAVAYWVLSSLFAATWLFYRATGEIWLLYF